MATFRGKLAQHEDKHKVMRFAFEQTTTAQLAEDVANFFITEGYKLEKGTSEKGVYGKGNQTLRILFGAFVKRFAFEFEILVDENNASLTHFIFKKNALNEISGGVIGYNQVNKEIKRLATKIQTLTA